MGNICYVFIGCSHTTRMFLLAAVVLLAWFYWLQSFYSHACPATAGLCQTCVHAALWKEAPGGTNACAVFVHVAPNNSSQQAPTATQAAARIYARPLQPRAGNLPTTTRSLPTSHYTKYINSVTVSRCVCIGLYIVFSYEYVAIGCIYPQLWLPGCDSRCTKCL